jgi:hypothetical protein
LIIAREHPGPSGPRLARRIPETHPSDSCEI